MIVTGVAKIVDEEYRTFDFVSWSALSVEKNQESVGLVGKMIRVPRVILLLTYEKMPKKKVRFSRINIFARDKNTCQYCGKKHQKTDLNLDHVIPKSQGGVSSWENVVTSCIDCNRRKGGKTPKQARMKLIKKPVRPNWSASFNFSFKALRYKQWKKFLNFVDISYWNVELED